jgi:uncharacterized protein YndB with AHSA1/START domain
VTGHTLTIERKYKAPAQRVFDAFTSEEVMRRWWHPAPDWETPEASVDLRVGGRIRVVMRDPDADRRYGGGGEYTDGVTTVRFTHSNLWDEEAVSSHRGGWAAAFDNLARAVEP